jgi:hypothetical protein
MKRILIAAALTFAIIGGASAQNLNKPWEIPTPSTHFPKFFSSNLKYDILLNDFFKRHFLASPGPGAYTGDQQTFWREWNALTTLWVDTSRNRVEGRDYNTDLKHFLMSIQMDQDGYVYTYPPASDYRNKLGWPFPDYTQSDGMTKGWDWESSGRGQDGWTIKGGGSAGIGENSLWNLIFTEPESYIQIDKLSIDSFQSPYIIITIGSSHAGVASLEWTTDKSPSWSEDNRTEFIISSKVPVDFYLPVYQYPGWTGKITGLRIKPLKTVPQDGVEVSLDRVQCAYDTRHVVNNTSFILASWRYYLWTGDDDFLKANMPRIRAAAHYLRGQLKGDKEGMVVIPYWGHDGTSGTSPKARPGYGLGSDYWDLLPMGHKSAYTNAYYVASLKAMADLEKAALLLNIKVNPYGENADSFEKQAKIVAKKAGDFFWDTEKGRFIGCEDSTGKRHDYGFVYLNLEALYYGLGDSTRASSIFSWLDGARTIKGDTSTGKDIYRWSFAPRTTTVRNADWYFWGWKDSKNIPWGGQVQDGGAVAYTSFYDIMNRIKYTSPDDAYERLKTILDWYETVWDVGGYRNYYASQPSQGTLQGGGRPGGLGIDAEFVETALVPTTFLYGFLGVSATAEGLMIEPKMPKSLTSVGVKNLTYRGVELSIMANPGKITVKCTDNPKNKSFLLNGRRITGTFEKVVDGNYATLKPGN